MTPEERFDASARKKLDERAFPFEEAHWASMRQALDKGKSGRSAWGLWSGGTAALIAVVAGLWWWNAGDHARHTEKDGSSATTVTGTTIETNAARSDEAKQLTPAREQVNMDGSASTAKAGKAIDDQTDGIDQKERSAESKNAIVHKADHISTSHRAPKRTEANASLTDPDNGQGPATMQPELIAPHIVDASIAELVGDMGTTAPGQEPDPIGEITPGAAISSEDLGKKEGTAAIVEVTEVGNGSTKSAEEMNTASHDAPTASGPTRDQEPDPVAICVVEKREVEKQEVPATAASPDAPDDVTLTHTTESEAVQDLLPVTANAQDSATTEVLDPADLAGLVPHHAPWEIGVFGGIQTTTTRYSGSHSDDWRSASEAMRSAAFGLEVMRMGQHFGVGTGLHYGTYEERLSPGELSELSTWIDPYWYLLPMDTTLFFITDTIDIGGQPYYTGQSINITVNVPTQGADTTSAQVVTREARTIVNRVGYFEVPLLLDAHLVQGRWQFGMRGGPTVGLLSGRRGALPNMSNDGYTSFTDQAFREVMFGWTARGYIRYRFNAGWSVGVEPMLRGQFGNGLEGGDLSRRSSALGGLISLTYRMH